MSEMEAYEECKKCNDTTIHLYSGSGTKGTCMSCGNNLPEEQSADLKRVISYNG